MEPAPAFGTGLHEDSDEVEAVILTLDREERKMSLGIKQLTSDPWEGIVSATR